MHRLYQSFAGQLVATQIALALALYALLAIAALIEGRQPGFSQNLPLILPIAGSFGAFWTLCQWRREGGDLGLYCCGRSSRMLIFLIILLTLPWFAVSRPHRDHFRLSGNQLVIFKRDFDSSLTLVFHPDAAQRSDLPEAFERFPAISGQQPHRPTHPLTQTALRVALLLLGLLTILHWPAIPHLTQRIVLSGVFAFLIALLTAC